MMNFLDLSAASEEERRVISEILSDTSVVNFAQQLEEQQEYSHLQHQQSQQVQQNNLRRQQNQHHHHQNQHQLHNQHIVNPKPTHQYQLQTHQQQIQQNNATTTTNSNNANQRLNNLHNHETPVTSDNQHQPNHVHVASQLAGDINQSVVGMDMSGSQHAGYPLSHPPSAHVPATYGPPPPHHMYGGPPIFQYTMPIPYTNIVYGNMSPYPVIIAPNSVVPPRQQVPPQSGQPPNISISTSSHSRSHSHHPRQNKMKEQLIKPNLQQQNQNATSNMHHQNHFNQLGNTLDINSTVIDKLNEGQENDYKSINSSNHLYNENVPSVEAVSDADDVTKSKPVEQQRNDAVKLENGINMTSNEDEVVKVSSDEGFDTQTSSLDVSKQSQDSSLVPITERSKTSSLKVECNSTLVEQPALESSESSKAGKISTANSSDEKTSQQGVWGSASSKSWASLFKGDGSAINTSLNGEIDQNNQEINTSDEDTTRNSHNKKLSSSENRSAPVSSRAVTSKEQRSQDAARRALDKMAPRLAQKINSITLKHSLPLLRPRGFINKGNGCYINSTLQALIACPPFYNLMKEIGDLKCLRRENSCTPIMDSFAELFLNFPPLDAGKKSKQFNSSDPRIQMSSLQAEPLEPKCIYDVLGQIKSECLRGK